MYFDSDILHPNRANISKDELRGKLAEMYKANKDQVNVFGLRTQFGGGKTTGFALVYDSPEALKKFEPHYRLVRVGFATKIEKPSRQQRMLHHGRAEGGCYDVGIRMLTDGLRQAKKEQTKDSTWYGEGQGCFQEEGEIDDSLCLVYRMEAHWCCGMGFLFVHTSHWLFLHGDF